MTGQERAALTITGCEAQLQTIARLRALDETWLANWRLQLAAWEAKGWLDFAQLPSRIRGIAEDLTAIATNGSPPLMVPVITKLLFVTAYFVAREYEEERHRRKEVIP